MLLVFELLVFFIRFYVLFYFFCSFYSCETYMFSGKSSGIGKYIGLGVFTVLTGAPQTIDNVLESQEFIPPFKGYVNHLKIFALNKTDTVVSKHLASCPSSSLNFFYGYTLDKPINEAPFLVKMQYNTYLTELQLEKLFKTRILDMIIEHNYYPDKSYDEILSFLKNASLDELSDIQKNIQFGKSKGLIRKH